MIDQSGKRYGHWTINSFSHKKDYKNGSSYYWNCVCDCGTEKVVSINSLRYGKTNSCGCKQKELAREKSIKHGASNEKIYYVWNSMIQRCENKKSHAYKHYGGRGITVCEEWRDSKKFFEWAYENGYKESLSIDRIDVDGNYEPLNCRWVDKYVQANNTRRNHYLTINGETKTVAEWARVNGIKYKLVYKRVNDCGWDFEKAVTEPVRGLESGKRICS